LASVVVAGVFILAVWVGVRERRESSNRLLGGKQPRTRNAKRHTPKS
jgi:hypothetical protein